MKGRQISFEGSCMVVVATFGRQLPLRPLLYLAARSEACIPVFQCALGMILKLNFNKAVYVKCIEIDFVL